jgi:hypothetical protein
MFFVFIAGGMISIGIGLSLKNKPWHNKSNTIALIAIGSILLFFGVTLLVLSTIYHK